MATSGQPKTGVRRLKTTATSDLTFLDVQVKNLSKNWRYKNTPVSLCELYRFYEKRGPAMYLGYYPKRRALPRKLICSFLSSFSWFFLTKHK